MLAGENPNGVECSMKLVVAYVDGAEYESLREELLSLGIPTLSVSDVAASLPEATVSATYRGTAIETHTRPKVRAECVVSDELVSTVVDAVLKREGKGAFTFVIAVEQANPMSYVATGVEAVEGVA
jgi:nitrogen regulatory protein P-II 1